MSGKGQTGFLFFVTDKYSWFSDNYLHLSANNYPTSGYRKYRASTEHKNNTMLDDRKAVLYNRVCKRDNLSSDSEREGNVEQGHQVRIPIMTLTDESMYITHENTASECESAMRQIGMSVGEAYKKCQCEMDFTKEGYEKNVQEHLNSYKRERPVTVELSPDTKIGVVDQFGEPFSDWKEYFSALEKWIAEHGTGPVTTPETDASGTTGQELKAYDPEPENKEWEGSEYSHNRDLDNADLFDKMTEDEKRALGAKSPLVYMRLYYIWQSEIKRAEDESRIRGQDARGFTYVSPGDEVFGDSMVNQMTTVPWTLSDLSAFGWLKHIPGLSNIPLVTKPFSISKEIGRLINSDKEKQKDLLENKYQKQAIAGKIIGEIPKIYAMSALIEGGATETEALEGTGTEGFLPDEYYSGNYSNAEPPLISNSSGDIKLYRTVSEIEYKSLMSGEKFALAPNSLESKWLSTNVADANAWGKKMDFGGNYKIVEITVPRSALDSMYYGGPKLDGIGPAYNATNSILNQYANTIKSVK